MVLITVQTRKGWQIMERVGRKKGLLAVIALCIMLMMSGCVSGDDPDFAVREDSTRKSIKEDPANIKYVIYLITMNQASNYWQQIDAGCKKAVKDLGGIDYHWIAPPKTNIAEQRECIDQAVAAGANAILLSAASETDLEDSLEAATAAGVKLIYVDSTALYPATATLATDNVAAGKIAAKTMKAALVEAGILDGVIGVAAGGRGQATTHRDRGFREEMEGSGYIVAPTFDMNGEQQNIKNAVKAHPDFVAFFGSNEQCTWALSSQVYDSGSNQLIIGFDTSDRTLDMMKKGVIYATMQQKPQQMGYGAIKIAVDALSGRFTQNGVVMDMGVSVITRNMI